MSAFSLIPIHRSSVVSPGSRGTDTGPLPGSVRHTGFLVTAAVVLVTALAGCGESDRTSSAPTEASPMPPPTPDYRQLTAAQPDEGSDAGEARGDEGRPDVSPPLPSDVSFSEAESLYHAGEYDRALRHFEAYVGDHPDNAWGHYMEGLSAWKAGERERAVTALDAALERDPDHVKSLINMSRVLLELDRPGDARPRIEKALELAPEDVDALRVAGNVALERGETERAERLYRQALALDGDDGWAANNLGLLLIRQDRFEGALLPLAHASELLPEEPVVLNNFGVALERTGSLAQAREHYGRAADAGHPKAGTSLARLEAVTGGDGSGSVDLRALASEFREQREGVTAEDLANDSTVPADSVAGEESGSPEPGSSEVDGSSAPSESSSPDSAETEDGSGQEGETSDSEGSSDPVGSEDSRGPAGQGGV